IDAGDAVTDGEHLADLGHFGFLAEILDLLLENCGKCGAANIHDYPIPFIAILRFCSLVLSELSTMREPTLTIRPPRMAGSTRVESCTSRPTLSLMASLRSSRCFAESVSAEVTSALISPFDWATSLRYALIMSARTKSRRFCAASLMKLRARLLIWASAQMASRAEI